MTDRELLELAARAAGAIQIINIDGSPSGIFKHPPERGILRTSSGGWNPFNNDGDALRLAAKLGLLIDCDNVLKDVEAVLVMRDHDDQYVRMNEPYGDDPYAATRRAIVRAAAEIGRGMEC